MDAITLLREDHKTVKSLFARIDKLSDGAHAQCKQLVGEVIRELSIHAAIEEQIFYPAVRAAAPDEIDMVLESLEEHHVVKWVLSELENMTPTDERYRAKVTVLKENVLHHAEEEESDLFPAVRKAMGRAALQDLGTRLEKAKKTAPTRPHPRTPDTPPLNLVAGIVAGAADRAREQGKRAVAQARKSAAGAGATTRKTTTTRKAATTARKATNTRKATSGTRKAAAATRKTTRKAATTTRKATRTVTRKATGQRSR